MLLAACQKEQYGQTALPYYANPKPIPEEYAEPVQEVGTLYEGGRIVLYGPMVSHSHEDDIILKVKLTTAQKGKTTEKDITNEVEWFAYNFATVNNGTVQSVYKDKKTTKDESITQGLIPEKTSTVEIRYKGTSLKTNVVFQQTNHITFKTTILKADWNNHSFVAQTESSSPVPYTVNISYNIYKQTVQLDKGKQLTDKITFTNTSIVSDNELSKINVHSASFNTKDGRTRIYVPEEKTTYLLSK